MQVIAVGKKARDYFVRTREDVIAEFIGIGDTTTLDRFVSETITLDDIEEALHKMERGEVLRSVVVL